MLRKKLFLLCFLLSCLGVVQFAQGSGTYRPPRPPKGAPFDRNLVVEGRKLFVGRSLVGETGQPCSACHGNKGSDKLRRSSLKKLGSGLFEQVNECVADSSRVAGSPLEAGSDSAKGVGAYLISRYRLPVRAFEEFSSRKSD